MHHLSSRLITLGGAALAATAVLAFPAAQAEASTSAYGVNHVDFELTPRFCQSPGGALPPGYGGAADCPVSGMPSNTVYVQQVEVDGRWTFETVSGTGATADHVWLPATYSTQCSGLRTLVGARVGNDDRSGGISAFEVTDWDEHLPVNTSNRTIPGRNLDLDVPIDIIELEYQHATGPFVDGEPTTFVELGEATIEERVDTDGVPEHVARQDSWSEVFHATFNGEVLCSGWGRSVGAADADTTPIEIVYLGIGEEPGPDWRDATIEPPAPTRDQQVDDRLTAAPAVTQANLIVMPDPSDPCRLLLSGTIATNEPMAVDYRFVDELGVPSQVFSVDVDHTQVAFLDHHVDLPVQLPSLEGGSGGAHDLTAGGPGGDLQLTAEDTDREQGWYRLQVVAPHSLTSELASYNVAPCTAPTGAPTVPTRG